MSISFYRISELLKKRDKENRENERKRIREKEKRHVDVTFNFYLSHIDPQLYFIPKN